MLIGIDGNEANILSRVGVGQFAFNILWQLSKLDHQNQYYIYLKDSPLPDLPPTSPNWQYKVFGPRKFWTKIALPFRLYTQKEKLSLFYSLSHYSPKASPFPTIPTIHDLGYLDFPSQFQKKDLYQLTSWTKDSLKKANHIVTVSQFTKDEICRIYNINPKMITVAFNGVAPLIPSNPSDDLEILTKYKIKKPYFLYLGTLKPSKNLPFLIDAYSKFLKLKKENSKFSLVIAGKKGWLFDAIYQLVSTNHLQNKIVFTDYINDLDRYSLYRQAAATVIPSVYEGFGIPAIESMQVGTPVIVSNIPAFREVCQSAALYINAKDPLSLVKQLQYISQITPAQKKILTKPGLVQANKFTWENSAKVILEVFKKFAA